MITGQYLVCCPKLDEREYVMGMDNAADVLYSMHCESDSYAWCEDWLGHTVMEYGDPVDGIAEMVVRLTHCPPGGLHPPTEALY
tara:strand:- start:1611 stop:1862 length:252 start_codon:yes stop_codon:yes gene_type:complete